MSSNQDQTGAMRRRRGRRDAQSDCTALSSRGQVRLLIATEGQAVADRLHTQPLTGSPHGRLELRSGGGAREPQNRRHNFDDPDLYARMHRECRRIYARAFGAISDGDWDTVFNFACGQAWDTEQRKGPIDQLAAWLTTVAHNAVVSEHRKTARIDLLADEEALTEEAIADLAETVDDRQLLRDAIFCLKTCLPERVRLVWTMRFAGDYEPSEIQRRLKISKKAYEKDLEHGSRLVVSRLESARHSGVCNTPDMASMVRAYAIWGERHGAERAKLTREHLEQCPACRQTVRALRATQRAAAFLPPPFLTLVHQHRSPLGAIWQSTDELALRVQDGLLRMKQFVVNLISRSPAGPPTNPDRAATVIGASSTGGAALVTKAVAGCLAAGVLASGTGACLKAAGVGVPGLSGLINSVLDSRPHRAHKPPSHHPWVESAQNLTDTLSANALQSTSTRPTPASTPTKPTAHHLLSSTVAARKNFGEPAANSPQPSQADVSAARHEFPPASRVAHSASSNGSTPAPVTPPSESHTSVASANAAEREFGGP
jgi:DNA-directed RNA polymerase specialized sigma24 family protein